MLIYASYCRANMCARLACLSANYVIWKFASHHSSNVSPVDFERANTLPQRDISQDHRCAQVEKRCQSVISKVLDTNNKITRSVSFSQHRLLIPLIWTGVLQRRPSQSCSCGIRPWRWSSTGRSWRSRRQRQTSPIPEGLVEPRESTPPGSTPDRQTPETCFTGPIWRRVGLRLWSCVPHRFNRRFCSVVSRVKRPVWLNHIDITSTFINSLCHWI